MKNNNIKKYLSPKKYFYYFLSKIKTLFSKLENKGERVEPFFKFKFLLNENDRCHINRYKFGLDYINKDLIIGDMACGTGYGSVILTQRSKMVRGVDIDGNVISHISDKYKNIKNLYFEKKDLLDIEYSNIFDVIFSFETIEHFYEDDIIKLMTIFHKSLKENGLIIFSTPYMQINDKKAIDMGFHRTFFIDEEKIKNWLSSSGFKLEKFYYQNYRSSKISNNIKIQKDFIICIAKKN